MRQPLLTVVIPTRNEEHNIQKCVRSFDDAVKKGWCEVLVVDNASEDQTLSLASESGAKVFSHGPERSAQRNLGWREASGDFVCFMDADMRMPPETLEEIRSIISSDSPPDAVWIREIRTGEGWWIKVRNFERSFYDATCIDALRVLSKPLLAKIDGFDVDITGFEDWDLDRKALRVGAHTYITRNALLHDEGVFSWRRHLKKKSYYSGFTEKYRKKWNNDEIVKKQLGLKYRFFGVFFENGKWKRAIRHPLLMSCIYIERAIVAICWLTHRRQ